MASRRTRTPNPYYRCELHCNHNLGRGMSLQDLLDGDDAQPPRLPARVTRPAVSTRLLPARTLEPVVP